MPNLTPSYKIHRIRKRGLTGITRASSCTLNAILKFDTHELPHCVYVEHVSIKLAQTLHIPVADGVLTTTGDGPTYASLELASPGIPLPDILKSQIQHVAEKYPYEIAALTAFDIFIGNWDRAQNIKASLVTPHMPIFMGFDHSHALLNIKEDPLESIGILKSDDMIVTQHPFFGFLSQALLSAWGDRISQADDEYITECCCFNRPFRAVTLELQKHLAEALVIRKKNLWNIIEENLSRIAPKL